MTELVPADAVHFSHGEPLCAYQECYRCFEGRDILFRLVNVEKKQWFFYNDTSDTIVHIRAVFAAGSVIKPLQRASLRVVPDADGVTDETCAIEVTLDVEPGYTESFIEGEQKGFRFEFRTETAPAKDVVFEYRRPTLPYDKIYKCFKNNGNGLLFRLVDDTAHRWYFYNDTREFMMKVGVVFANADEVRALGKTVVSAAPAESGAAAVSCVLSIAPGQTEAFIEGEPVTYALDFSAEPYVVEEPIHYLHGSPDASVIPHQSHVYKCFKEHGNGLLFRIVDDYNTIWAFYNDTTEYSMTANMRFTHSDGLQLAPGVEVLQDTEREGGFIAAVIVPPLATVPFLVGTPLSYELAFSATPVQSPTPSPATSAAPSTVEMPVADSAVAQPQQLPPQQQPPLAPVPAAAAPAVAAAAAAVAAPPVADLVPQTPVPEEVPVYLNGQPDPAVMPRIDEVYKCFKEHGNGLLFRLVDTSRRCWAFYNDTTDTVATVMVEFHPAAQVTAFGKAQVERDAETGRVCYSVCVNPLETVLFVQGDVEIFTTKFTAERLPL